VREDGVHGVVAVPAHRDAQRYLALGHFLEVADVYVSADREDKLVGGGKDGDHPQRQRPLERLDPAHREGKHR
jgi:hypothetical protein